ncbi:hypothetical protein DPMN_169575 [Dreissena polymorpha]|uniref:Uncharacterized protein n=1 Tax=Dreissena polymorpha TaxID=45954 RepID=A0A9D4IDR5_DREPO|nr:hypothetical protein DPMN_169575 [Dreissena polymorpha]
MVSIKERLTQIPGSAPVFPPEPDKCPTAPSSLSATWTSLSTVDQHTAPGRDSILTA